MLTDISNKSRIAIVAVGYNRINSMKRLIGSLLRARYNIDNVPLYISIDCSGDQELYDYVNSFEWPYGDKYVNIQKERLGLKNHILQCGDLTKYFKGVIILEDDIFVSEYFYDYVLQAVDYYYDDNRIGGISLYRNEMGGNIPIYLAQDGNDVFLRQSVASWGQCWTDKMWAGFREWFNKPESNDLSHVDMPEYIKGWSKAWSKFYMAYQVVTNKYFVFPSISLTTCFSEAGEHGSTCTIGQVNLLCGEKKYKFQPFDKLSKYDIYSTNECIYDWIGISKEQLAVDLRGCYPDLTEKKFVLSPYPYPYAVVKSFSLSLLPIELNVKYNLEGNGIFLYDISKPTGKKLQKNIPIDIAYYYIKTFNVRLLARYVLNYSRNAILDKLSKKWRKIRTRR